MKASTLSLTIDRDQAVRIAAWSLTILLSWVPDILFYELTGNVPIWLVWVKVGLVFSFIALSYVWKEIRVLRNYALIFGVMWLAIKGEKWVLGTEWYQNLLASMTTISSGKLLGEYVDLIQAAIMILALLAIHRRWDRFFFAGGDTSLDTEPVPALGIPAGMSIRTFTVIFTLFFAVGSLIWRGSLGPTLSMVSAALPLLPIILFGALLNSFHEEVVFRASFLSVSHDIAGKGQAIWMTAFVFGTAHYIGGSVSLLLGVVITTSLGWALAKVMLESRSILLPWALHFTLNVISFFFNEMGISLARF